jgi:hypothetical protein
MPEQPGTAEFSRDGVYRYRLTRTWGEAPPATFIMLNPSTADADKGDRTVDKCIVYARSWGCGGLVVGNLYGLRSPYPSVLKTVSDPVGPDNDIYLRLMLIQARIANAPVIVAWGNHAERERVQAFQRLLNEVVVPVHSLHVNKNGQPGHPCRLPYGLPRTPWPEDR